MATFGSLDYSLDAPFGWGNVNPNIYDRFSSVPEGLGKYDIVRKVNPSFVLYTTNQWVTYLKNRGQLACCMCPIY